jgi:hypothetical protein
MSSVTPAFAIRFLCFLLARCCCKDCSDRHRTPGQSLHLTAIPLSGATSFGGLPVSSVGVSSLSLSLCSSSSEPESSSSSSEPVSSSSSEPVSESSSPDERSESSESSSSAPRPSFSGSESSSVESSARAPCVEQVPISPLIHCDGALPGRRGRVVVLSNARTRSSVLRVTWNHRRASACRIRRGSI